MNKPEIKSAVKKVLFGIGRIEPEEWDRKFGVLIVLLSKKK